MTHDPQEAPGWPSARQTAAAVQAGTLAADDLARATLSRIAEADAELGAFVCTLDADVAAAQALRLRGPLAGVPVAVKDNFDTRDLPTAYGSPIYTGHTPRVDAPIVSALRRAGGLAIGKSTTTEFAFLEPTATRNPMAPGRTPGGSSAGSAAAVAAGLVPLALGSQTAGSVIRPASYCGVVGYKPSAGWLPTAGMKCFSWSLDTTGFFARDVADVAWFAQALAGRALAIEADRQPLGTVIVGIPEAYPWGELSPSAVRAMAAGTRALQAVGIDVRRCALPAWSAAAFEAHAVIQAYEAWRSLAWEFDERADALSPALRDYLRGAAAVTPETYEAAQQGATQARTALAAGFEACDLLLTPSTPDEAPLGYTSTGPSTFNRLWTLLGLPCISVPGARGDNGLPVGLQLIAPHGADARLLQVADRLERALQPTMA